MAHSPAANPRPPQLSLDRQLLAGLSLVHVGEVTEAAAADTARRCARRGMAFVQAVAEGTPEDALEGQLTFYVRAGSPECRAPSAPSSRPCASPLG